MPRVKKATPTDLVTATGVDPNAAAVQPTPEGAPAPVAAPPQPKYNADSLAKLGAKLKKDFGDYDRDRRTAEQQWAKSLRQFLGIYDQEVNTMIGANRSKAYPKLTRVKVISMLSRLMNLLFPASEKNWTIAPSPVPNLTEEDLQSVLDKMQQSPDAEMSDEAIAVAVMEFARERAMNLETEIEDQLTELGGSGRLNYVALARKVLLSGIMYGMGVLKGPFARSRVQTRWTMAQPDPENPQAPQKIVPQTAEVLVPQYEFVPIWDYYPDMSAKYLHQMDGQFQRIVMSRQQIRDLMEDKQFNAIAIKKWLNEHKEGNYKEKQFEVELRTMGLTEPAARPNQSRKYEVLVWDGGLSGHYLDGCGVTVPEGKRHEMVQCIVWLIDDVVIRGSLNPWVTLEEDEHVNTYHHFMFEEDDSTLVGNGLPQIMRDSQLGVCAATRMTLDNASIVCGPSVEVNRSLIRKEQDNNTIHAYQVWNRDDEESSATANQPAVREILYTSHIGDLKEIVNLFQTFADSETFVNPATGGDMQQGPSEPFRTAAGASMLTGFAALPFKDVVRNFDTFTESWVQSLIMFNKHFNTKPSLSGDFQAVARGATSLIAKEVRGMAIDELARSLTPGEALYIDSKGMLKERLMSRDIPVSTVMCSDAEATRREQAQSEQQSDQADMMKQMMTAEIRKMVADAAKALTQADKNSTAAEVQLYTAIGKGLVDGITPKAVADTRAGGPVPAGVVRKPNGPVRKSA